ncbi:hypothetical protein EIP86_001491 [Pleurotus ostreatoroseus]|nr:hypothetical protein EIP86_001491 [Pleurotus ostreatoroseus]
MEICTWLYAYLPLRSLSCTRWKRMRRAALEGFSSRAITAYHALQERHAAHFVRHMLEDPDSWDDHVRRSAASIVLSVVYGWPPIDATADPVVEKITEIIQRIARSILPGAHLVDLIPFMAYIPDGMAKWKREAKAHFHQDSKFFEELFNDVKAKALAGTAEPCLVSTLVEGKHDLDTRSMAWLSGTLFGGGAETTAGALSVFILAMVLYPETMRRAHAQIDAVVGRDRLPNLGDRAHLLYIEAIVKEVQRWRPGGPLSVPRQTTEDDVYNGYFIPKGTLILLNVWAINHDPNYFPDYDEFRPERYLDEREQLIEPMPNTHAQGHMSYGTGRRYARHNNTVDD